MTCKDGCYCIYCLTEFDAGVTEEYIIELENEIEELVEELRNLNKKLEDAKVD